MHIEHGLTGSEQVIMERGDLMPLNSSAFITPSTSLGNNTKSPIISAELPYCLNTA